MDVNKYKNFVRESSSEVININNKLNGDEAKRLYLEEISTETRPKRKRENLDTSPIRKKSNKIETCTDKDLFVAVQNGDFETVCEVLNNFPNKLNATDEYGWSLLMIACQANAVDIVKELLKRNAKLTIRDRAGNSAVSLVIKNKNLALIDLFINNEKSKPHLKTEKKKSEYTCEVCGGKSFEDGDYHLASTVHNINASKTRKTRPCYKIPATNRGYQLMVKGGWDRTNGLGPSGSGNKYPIRTIQKLDKKGLGLEKLKKLKTEDLIEINRQRKSIKNNYYRHKRFEINFRREFY